MRLLRLCQQLWLMGIDVASTVADDQVGDVKRGNEEVQLTRN
jgi:hypothetical protein